MIVNTWNMSLSPGQRADALLGLGAASTTPGTRNYMGMDSPAAEAMIADMLATRDPDEFVAAVQALDRVLTTGRYVIPFWFADKSDIAYKADLQLPGDAAGLRRLDRLAARGLVARPGLKPSSAAAGPSRPTPRPAAPRPCRRASPW